MVEIKGFMFNTILVKNNGKYFTTYTTATYCDERILDSKIIIKVYSLSKSKGCFPATTIERNPNTVRTALVIKAKSNGFMCNS